MLKSHRSLCESFSRTGAGLCIYHLFVWSNWNFLHISQWITLPTQSCLALYSFGANLLHSLIMWLIVSSLSPHSLHLLLCCVLSILTLIWLVLITLSCAAIRRDSVSHLRFSFLSQVHYYYYYYYYYSRQILHTNLSWCSLHGIWMTASFLKSPGLFSVNWMLFGSIYLPDTITRIFPSTIYLSIYLSISQSHTLAFTLSADTHTNLSPAPILSF